MIRGEIWWADLGIPFGSEPGFKRPVVVIQDDSFNRSKIRTTIIASITTNLNLADAPGNVFIESEETGLPKNGVVNISQVSTIDKRRLTEKVCVLSQSSMSEIDYGLKLVLNIQ
ncbi:MAG: type II toxin-antitoxin system PemK/MazF family toxin [Spirochaetales bacterium]|nr:type II toxin-antitoxin system PemK/MazF family toxin [Spirochaetales bacterium]